MRLGTKHGLLLCVMVALFGLTACSDDEKKSGSDVVTQEDVGGGGDGGLQDTSPPTDKDADEINLDIDESDRDIDEVDLDADEVDRDIDESDPDADEVDRDIDEVDRDIDEVDRDADEADLDADEVDPDVSDPGPVLPGDTCDDAIDVTAGGVFKDQTTTGYSDSYDPNRGAGCAWFSTKEDRVYVVTPVLKTKYKVKVTPDDGSEYDPVLYARLDCGADACIAGTNFGGKGVPESIEIMVEAGESAFIIVDGLFGSVGYKSHGDFTLEVEIVEEFQAPDPDPEPMVGGESCDNPIDVTAGGVFEDHSTIGAGSFYDPGRNEAKCPGSNITGPERIYSVTPAVETDYKITVVPKDMYNPMIYVRANCAVESTCLGGQRGLGAGRTISTTFTAPAGVPSFVVVDGLWEKSGDKDAGVYTLNVEILP